MHSKTATYQVSYFLSKLLFQILCFLRALTFSKQLYYSFTRATFPKVAVFRNSWFSAGNLEEFFGRERYWLAADEHYYLKITVPAIKVSDCKAIRVIHLIKHNYFNSCTTSRNWQKRLTEKWTQLLSD